jgi:hypothetical protein
MSPDELGAIAQASADRHGCTCAELEIELRHTDLAGLLRFTVRHDDGCPAIEDRS